MTNINKVKIIKYDLSCNLDFDEKRVAFILFDLLGFKNNIVMNLYRTYYDKDNIIYNFANKINCQIIANKVRRGCFCLYIPKIETNLQLMALREAMDVQTEVEYFPNISNFSEFLFNTKNLKSKEIIKKGIVKFQAYLDIDYGMTLYFDTKYFLDAHIENILNNWENSLLPITFKRVNN